MLGPAGTGKTYLAICKAVEALQKGEVARIILSRPAVEAGEMSLNAAVETTKPAKPKEKNGTEKVTAAKLVDALTKQHVGHIARGLTAIAAANGGEGTQFAMADSGLNKMITALQSMREGNR